MRKHRRKRAGVHEPQNNETLDEHALIDEHSKLVFALAKRFTHRGVETEELIQSGFVGLIGAAKSFDPSFGAAFSSYAFKFIEGAMRECVRMNRLILLPKSRFNYLLKLKAQADALSLIGEGAVGTDEAAKRLGMDAIELASGLTELDMALNISSLDDALHVSSPQNGQPEYETLNPEDACIDRAYLNDLLDKTEKLERQVLELRFLSDKTQAETAEQLDISQASVSKIEKSALLKLKKLIGSDYAYE